MVYPDFKSHIGESRCLVCMDDEKDSIEEALNSCDESCYECLMECMNKWLNENSYCVEKWQLEEYLKNKGCEISEDMDGGGLATLGDVGGMGNPATPANDGTNAGFYNPNNVGSGDKFSSLTVGTSAANKRKKVMKKLKSYLEFSNRNKK